MARLKVAERRTKVDELRLQGYSAYAVSKKLGIPVGTVYNDYKALEAEEQEAALKATREQKRQELDKQFQRQIRMAEKLLMKVLRPSKKIKEVRKAIIEGQEISDQNSLKLVEREEETYLPHYNAAIGFQRNLLEALARRAALWGAERPKQLELTGKDGGPLQVSWMELVKNAEFDQPLGSAEDT